MTSGTCRTLGFVCLGALVFAVFPLNSGEAPVASEARAAGGLPPATIEEARSRARLLHDSLHATLQYVHREYYRENEGLKIPAATLKGVFRDLEEKHKLKLRWLAVNARAMNVDHEPADTFDKDAVKAINGGQESYDAVEDGHFRFAGAVVLHAECLKCHLPARSSNKPKAAALLISIPLSRKSDVAAEEK